MTVYSFFCTFGIKEGTKEDYLEEGEARGGGLHKDYVEKGSILKVC